VGADFDTVVVTPLSSVSAQTSFQLDTSFAIGAFATCGGSACGTGVTQATTCP